MSYIAEFVNDDINYRFDDQPLHKVYSCGARFQEHYGKKLPCASCHDEQARFYVMLEKPRLSPPVPRKPWYFPQPEPVKIKEIIFERRPFIDSRFPNRRAAFWWYSC